jgi:NAD(P)-dependent dehydrogenase (short-subunit alcohol dehydrogenase family)
MSAGYARAVTRRTTDLSEPAPSAGSASAEPVMALPADTPRHDFAERARIAIEVLEAIRGDRPLLLTLGDEDRARLLRAAGEVARPDPWTKRELARAAQRKRKEQLRAADEARLAQTGIRKKRLEEVFLTPMLPTPELAEGHAHAETVEVQEERACYVCKRRFTSLHFFYDAMCAPCGDLNFAKRSQTADLRGRVALVTGSRVKIGYQAAIMLLRAGCQVIVTTRFPRDAAARYAREPDFEDWGSRLSVHGLDLRHTPSVELFTKHLNSSLERLDFIINNACQTVRRPAGFYGHLMTAEESAPSSERERRLLAGHEQLRSRALALVDHGEHTLARKELITSVSGLSHSAGLSQLALLEEDLARGEELFPRGKLDADLQQVDLRKLNSWRLPMADVSAVELLEVQLVNAVAPFLLNARLKPLMQRVPSRDKHVVNVSAMEGQFYRMFKTDKHPHTNMAKAALNMMTRTSAADYIKDGIHMNSVDTGWVTDEDAAEIAARKTREQGFHPPLDIVDGAARIVDPIFDGINTGKHVWGLFLKDYAPTHW